MPSTKTKKPNPSKTTLWHKPSFWALFVISILVLGGLSYSVYSHVQEQRAVTADRERFEAADRDVHSVAALIKSQVPPEKESYKKECTTQSRDYEKEPIICGISYFFLGGANSVDEANLLGDKVRKIVMTEHAIELKPMSVSPAGISPDSKPLFSNSLANVTQTSSNLFVSRSSGLSCSIIYQTYPSSSPFPPEEGLVSQLPSSVLVTVYCHDQVKTQLY